MAKDAQAVSNTRGEKQPAGKPAPISPDIDKKLTAEQRAAVKKTLWRERLLSLWSPITIFGALFAVYILIIELHTPAYRVGKPLMDAFGLLAVIALIALAVLRYAVKPFGALRAARHNAREALAELDATFSSRVIAEPQRSRAVELAVAVELLYPANDAAAIDKATEALGNFIEKDLGRKRYGADFAWGFVKAFAIAMLIRTIVIEPFKIPSGSMIPTLEIGDQIFVNKFIYGVRIPYLNLVPFKIIREPDRGDVIVFENPLIPTKDFVKRVIAVPGDTVVIQNEIISINGVQMPRTEISDKYQYMDQDADSTQWQGKLVRLNEENLAGHKHATLQALEGGCFDGTFNGGRPFTVPPNAVFVMGDNRDNSSDSRYGLGTTGACTEKLTFVPYGNIKGKAMVVWLSLSHNGFLSGVFGGTGLRTDRLFLPVR